MKFQKQWERETVWKSWRKNGWRERKKGEGEEQWGGKKKDRNWRHEMERPNINKVDVDLRITNYCPPTA